MQKPRKKSKRNKKESTTERLSILQLRGEKTDMRMKKNKKKGMAQRRKQICDQREICRHKKTTTKEDVNSVNEGKEKKKIYHKNWRLMRQGKSPGGKRSHQG